MIAHVVLFKPKGDLRSIDLGSFARTFTEAIKAIPSIRRVRIGPIQSITALPASNLGDKPYSLVAYLEFDDQDGLDSYIGHPMHGQLAQLFWKYCDATVFADAPIVDPTSAEIDLEQIFGLKT